MIYYLSFLISHCSMFYPFLISHCSMFSPFLMILMIFGLELMVKWVEGREEDGDNG